MPQPDTYKVQNLYLYGGVRCWNTFYLMDVNTSGGDPVAGNEAAGFAWSNRVLFEWSLLGPRGLWFEMSRVRRVNNGGGPVLLYRRRLYANPFGDHSCDSLASILFVWHYKDNHNQHRHKRLYWPGVGKTGTTANRISNSQWGIADTIATRLSGGFTVGGRFWGHVAWDKDHVPRFLNNGTVLPFIYPLKSRRCDRLQPTIERS